MNYIFIDFEMHPIDKIHKEQRKIAYTEIIEFGAVILNDKFEEFAEFKSYVHPLYSAEVLPQYTRLTHITSAMVHKAESFPVVLEKFADWCFQAGDDFKVYAWSENDLAQLKSEMRLKEIPVEGKYEKIVTSWYDFQKEYCDLIKLSKPISLSTALEILGEDFSGAIHDALWDARNTARLFALSQDHEEFEERKKTLCLFEEAEPVTVSLGELFDFSKLQLKS